MFLITYAVVSSYYFVWGENEETVTDPVDETGWVPDGAFAGMLDESPL